MLTKKAKKYLDDIGYVVDENYKLRTYGECDMIYPNFTEGPLLIIPSKHKVTKFMLQGWFEPEYIKDEFRELDKMASGLIVEKALLQNNLEVLENKTRLQSINYQEMSTEIQQLKEQLEQKQEQLDDLNIENINLQQRLNKAEQYADRLGDRVQALLHDDVVDKAWDAMLHKEIANANLEWE